MSSTLGAIPPATTSAVNGIKREFQRFDQAAADVATAGPAASNATVLEISDEARAASSQLLGAGLEQGLIDERVAKYSAIANMRTLQTADEMSQELTNLVGRK